MNSAVRVYPHRASASTLSKDPIDLYCAKHTKLQTVTLAMTLENRFKTHSQASTLPLTLGVGMP